MQQILTKESYTVDYAGFWWRSGAMVIDLFVLWGINFLITHIWNLATGLPWGGLTQEMIDAGATAPLWFLRFVVFFIVQVGYFVCFWVWKGQTIGKFIMRIKVTKIDATPVTWGTALLRYGGYIISLVVIGIGFFWLAFDSRRQGFHDKIAETFVVRIPTGKERKAWQVQVGRVEIH